MKEFSHRYGFFEAFLEGYRYFRNYIYLSFSPGYHGSNCQYEQDPCDSSPCQNTGTCETLPSNDGGAPGYRCHCQYGYKGPHCGALEDWCALRPCQNAATCVQRENRYTCECRQGWRGVVCDIPLASCENIAISRSKTVDEVCR